MRVKHAWMAGLAVVVLAGCGQSPEDKAKEASKALQSPSAAKVGAAANDFGFRLFTSVVGPTPKANTLISPTGAAMVLDMVYNGAAGTTKTEMSKVLAVQGIADADINNANQHLIDLLPNADPKVEMQIANGLWVNKGCKLKDEFGKLCIHTYGAMAVALDFEGKNSAYQINSWFEDTTHEKIKHMVDTLGKQDQVFLADAIYFKGQWKDKFDKDATKPGDFHKLDGKTAKAQMMTRTGKYGYVAGPGFQAVSLPYGSGRFAMCVFLPDAKSSLAAFLKTLSAANWDGWVKAFKTGEGTVTIPRFRTEYEAVLSKPLSAMGMPSAFATGADFSAMCSPAVFLSTVKQKTFVYVDEEGTIAAAATEAVAAKSDEASVEPFTFIADRPFFYAIRDTVTGSVLFMGVLVEPE